VKLKYAIIAVLGTGALMCISALPGRAVYGYEKMSIQVLYNLAHIPGYAFLSFLWLKVFERSEKVNRYNMLYLFVLMGVAIFSVSTELYQAAVPGRTASSMDVGLNFAGILLGLGMFHIKKRNGELIKRSGQDEG
jgi:VanZ family protein